MVHIYRKQSISSLKTRGNHRLRNHLQTNYESGRKKEWKEEKEREEDEEKKGKNKERKRTNQITSNYSHHLRVIPSMISSILFVLWQAGLRYVNLRLYLTDPHTLSDAQISWVWFFQENDLIRIRQ